MLQVVTFVAQFTIATPVVMGPTLPQIQAIVFGPTCATGGCHTGGGAGLPGALDLSSEQASFDNLVNIAALQVGGGGAFRVLPGDPDNSYLIQKLEDNQMAGGQMPPGTPLQQSVIDDIRLLDHQRCATPVIVSRSRLRTKPSKKPAPERASSFLVIGNTVQREALEAL